MTAYFYKANRSIQVLILAIIVLMAQNATAQNSDSIPPFNPFSPDSIFRCNVDTVLLDAGPGYGIYAWNTGDTTQMIQATRTGTYIVGVINDADSTLYDTVLVSMIRHSIDAISTQNVPFLKSFDSVSDKSLIIRIQYPYNQETIVKHNKGSIWVPSEDCAIDSLTISIISYSPNNSTEPSFGVLTVYEVAGDPMNGKNIIQGTYYWAVNTPGLITLPVNLFLKKGKTYHFSFGKGAQKTQSFFGNNATLRAGVVEGFSTISDTYNPIDNGVWMKLQGRRINYQDAGNSFYSCFSYPFILNANGSNYNYAWSTGMTTPSIKVHTQIDTTIYLRVSNSYHSCYDSATINLFNVSFNPFVGDSIFACSYPSFPLNAKTDSYYYYNWSTGSKDTSIFADTDAWYKVSAEGGPNCLATDSVFVRVLSASKKSYRFIGNGLYSDPANWEILGIQTPGPPPTIIGPHESIYIDPSGVCIMDIQQIISDCSDFSIRPNAKIIIQSSLIIKK